MGWADWPRLTILGPSLPSSAPSSFPSLLVSSRTFTLLYVGLWRHFLHGLDRGTCRESFNIFCSSPQRFLPSRFGPWAIWSHVHFMSWLVPCFMIFSQGAQWISPGSLSFLALKSCTNNKLQKQHARVNVLYQGGQYQCIRYQINANTEGKLMARLTEIHRQQVTYASLWMILTPQTSGITFDLRVFGGARGGALYAWHLRFQLIGVISGSKILGIAYPIDASHLPKIWALSMQPFGRSMVEYVGLTSGSCLCERHRQSVHPIRMVRAQCSLSSVLRVLHERFLEIPKIQQRVSTQVTDGLWGLVFVRELLVVFVRVYKWFELPCRMVR
jgi:hypothetical protein